MDSNCRFRAFLSLRSSSVFSIPRSRSAKGTDAESGTEAMSLKPSSGKNRVGSRSLSAAHDSKLVAFPVYTSVGPSNVSRIFSATVAPTNASPGENRMQSIVGTWKLLHATARDAAGAARPLPYGGKALGRVTFTADGAFR